jgi:hypothetical protein
MKMTPELKAKFDEAFVKITAKYTNPTLCPGNGEFADDIFDLVKQEFPECKIECESESGRCDMALKFKMIATRAMKVILKWRGGTLCDNMWRWQIFTFDSNTLSYRRGYENGYTSSTEFPYDILKKIFSDAIKSRVDETGDIIPKILKYVKKRLKLEISYRKAGTFKYVLKVQERDVCIQQINDKIVIGGVFFYGGFEESETIEIADPKSINKIVEKIVDTVRHVTKGEIINFNNEITVAQNNIHELHAKQIILDGCILPELDEEEDK